MQVKNRAVLGQISDMDLRLLRVFRSVVECGGMAAAELELNIATSTISRHIKDLETRLGLTLCRRGRGGFALTPEGERIHAETLRLLAATDGFRASVDDIHQRMGGELHLAVFDKTASNPEAHIAQAVALFREGAPEVALNLHVGSLNLIERGVMDGQFQLGIIPEHRRSDSLAYDELFGETMLLYCGAAHPLFEAGADRADLGAPAQPRLCRPGLPLAQHGARPPRAPARDATGFDQESVATLILSGRFLGFLPDHYAEAFVRAGRCARCSPELFRYACRFSGITRRSPAPSRVTRAAARMPGADPWSECGRRALK